MSREESSPEAGFRGHVTDCRDAFGSLALTHDAITRITTLLFAVTSSSGQSGGWVGLEGSYDQYICSVTADSAHRHQGLPSLEVTTLHHLAHHCARCTATFGPYANNPQPL